MIHWTAEAGQRLMATDRDTVKRFRLRRAMIH